MEETHSVKIGAVIHVGDVAPRPVNEEMADMGLVIVFILFFIMLGADSKSA
jgi:hypothetical protein